MVDALVQVVFDNINSLLQKEVALIWGVDGEIRRLSGKLDIIRAVLQDAEMKQFKDKAIKCWLKKLKAAAYDADDILDECAARALQLEETPMSNCTSQVSLPFSSCFNFEQLMFRRKIGKRIKDVRECIDEIADEGLKFNLDRRGSVEWTVGIRSGRETCSTLTDPRVYGRDEDQEEIVKVLVDKISNPNLLVYPIIGMGGLGKTTLAQLLYHHERVKNHFETRIWVCVSDDFNVQRLTKAIIEDVSGAACDLTELNAIQNRLREMLGGKRYLIVLDDVWNENQDKWEKMKSSLTCGNAGSAILVTTRFEKIASIMGTFPAHHLKLLSEDDCWTLFKQRAFGDGDAREKNTKLEAIGKEIMNKCGGVPLAAKALGSLMRFKHTEDEWLFVRESEIWDLPEDEENNILPALRLSYYHLPSHLRQCFAFCSIFPKDHEMEKEQLVRLWMANGFIPSRGNMELEDIGNEIFNELLWRSFFQGEGKIDDDGNVRYYKMHDLVHDLACSVMDNECLTFDPALKKNIVPKGIRHLKLDCEGDYSSETFLSLINKSLSRSEAIRTLLIDMEDQKAKELLPHLKFSNHKSLRALELCGYNYSSSVGYVINLGYLIHLRCLSLYDMRIETLPESLGNLKHLQTLNLWDCGLLHKLPTSLCTISSLRHLDIVGCSSLKQMPIGIGKLINLQTLSVFTVGKKSGCHISELKDLNKLRGSLHIQDLENVLNSEDAKAANLIRKRKIESLTLSWSPDIDQAQIQQNASEGVLEGLQPPESVKRLIIKGYLGMKFPSWMEDLSLLQNLVRLQLSSYCNRCEHLPPFGNLPCLKFLYLGGMDSVRHLGVEMYDDSDGSVKGFPSLEELVLDEMVNLEGLRLDVPEGRGVLPCLVTMRITNCHKLTTLPLLPSLHTLSLDEIDNIPEGLLQIRNLPVLQQLSFNRCSNLVTLPRFSITPGELQFRFLETFRVHQCGAMKSLWDDETQFQALSSLKTLEIRYCSRLTSLSGMRYLTALEELTIDSCPDLELSQLEDFQHLTSLRTIEFWGDGHSISWPESLKHVTTLEHLTWTGIISAFPDWIDNLTSLQTIRISHCPDLTFLPDGLRQLTALQILVIDGCNDALKTRCREGGEDWHKISHIPNVIIHARP